MLEHHRAIYGPPPEVAAKRQIKPLKAPMPTQPLEGCMVSAALLAHLLLQKYVWHLPLYRQEEFFQQAGLFIRRSTLCDWVQKAAFALGPIARGVSGKRCKRGRRRGVVSEVTGWEVGWGRES